MGDADWAELALVSRVDQWVAAHPYLFIVSTAKMVRPARATATVTGLNALRIRESVLTPTGKESESGRVPTGAFRILDLQKPKGALQPTTERGGRPLVLPLRKVQSTFPSMITVGRTENNDLVVPDEQVSKFHAFFRLVTERVELSDAGSRNGTFVSGRRLESRGAGAQVRINDKFAFGAIEFQLFDARGCWEWLRQLDRFA
jgi:FHA domain-containing protein